jgi:hypothetical protein
MGPDVGFINYRNGQDQITVNYKCWCGDGYARAVRLEATDDYIRIPYSVFSTEGLNRQKP